MWIITNEARSLQAESMLEMLNGANDRAPPTAAEARHRELNRLAGLARVLATALQTEADTVAPSVAPNPARADA
jgi:hypothetical protein